MIAAMLDQGALHPDRTREGGRGVVERDEEAVSGVVSDRAAMCRELGSEHLIVPAKEVLPGVVADQPDQVRGLHDVGEHQSAGDVLVGTAGADLGHEAGDEVQVREGADAFETGPGGVQFEEGGAIVAERVQRATDQCPRSGDFVRGPDLLPPFLRATELRQGAGRLPVSQQDRAMDGRRERPHRHGLEVGLQGHQFFVGCRRGRQVVHGQGDLRLRRQQPDAPTPVVARTRQRLLDPGGRRSDIASSQLGERETGLRVEAVSHRLRMGLLRTPEVAHQPAHLADLVVRRPEAGEEVESGKLLARHPGLLLGLGQRPSQAHQFRPVDPADAREGRDRLPFTPSQRRVGPLGRASVVAQLRACSDHAAVDIARRIRAEFATHHGRHGLVEQGSALVHPPQQTQGVPLVVDAHPEEIAIPRCRGEFDGPVVGVDRLLVFGGEPREEALHPREPPVHRPCRVVLRQVHRPRRPPLRLREFRPHAVLLRDAEGDHGGRRGVTLLQIRAVGALQVLDGLVGVSGPVGGGGEEREPFTAERMSIVGAGQDLVGLGPRMSLECPPPRDDRVVGWCSHVRILRRWAFRSVATVIAASPRSSRPTHLSATRPIPRHPGAWNGSGAPEGHAHPKGER